MNAEREGTKLSEELERWQRDTLRESLENMPERKREFATLSGIQVDRVYLPHADADGTYMEKLGLPGEYPFTRGIRPTMYRSRPWTIRLFSGFATADETNQRYRYLIEQGQMGLSVAFDMATLMGLDSDDPRSRGEIGRGGVAIDSLADMEVLFDQIPLDRVSTSMTINGPACILFSFYLALARKRGIDSKRLRGTIQNDILKEYTAQKSWLFPPRPSMRVITDIFAYGLARVPQWNTISISGYHIREAGATAVQELAFTLADGLAYVQAGIEAGLEVDAFAPRLSFFFNAHNDLFEEIAKFRAARRIWAREMRHRFGAEDPHSWLLRFHTQTAGCSLTAQQPHNNVVRVALQALAAVLGGTQSLHTNALDETLALPTEEAATLALRTQQIIAHETNVTHTVDPLGGSYFVEAMTDRMEEEAMRYIRKIDDLGGMVAAIEKGFPQREIVEASFRFQQMVDSKEYIMVGVNEFHEEEKPPPILKIGREVEEKQIQKLRELRKKRDNAAVPRRLKALQEAARGGENLMPFLVDAATDYATEGEMAAAMKEVFGEYHEPAIF